MSAFPSYEITFAVRFESAAIPSCPSDLFSRSSIAFAKTNEEKTGDRQNELNPRYSMFSLTIQSHRLVNLNFYVNNSNLKIDIASCRYIRSRETASANNSETVLPTKGLGRWGGSIVRMDSSGHQE